LQPNTFRLYEAAGHTFAWLPATLQLLELDAVHAEAARLLLRKIEAGTNEALTAVDERIASALEALDAAGFGSQQLQVNNGVLEAEPMGFRISLTENCDFACEGCFSTTALRQAGKPLRTMTRQTLESVLDEVIVPWARRRSLRLHFFGGEPMLRFPLIKLATLKLHELTQAGDIHPTNFSMTTNGSILSDDRIAFFTEHGFDVGVSVELTAAIHDQIRIDMKGRGTFDRVVGAYRKLREFGCTSHVLVTPYPPLPDNALDAFAQLLERFPGESITVNTPFDGISLGWLGAEEHLTFLLGAHRICREAGVSIDSALTPILSAISSETPRLSPQATTGNQVMLGIAPDGQVVRSTHKFADAYAEDAAAPQLPSTWRKPCRSCEAALVCGGPNEEYQVATGLDVDAEKCTFHRRALPLLVQELDVFRAK
jgi:sulfatase maturation enzyme AslB (radical SAM superfamily)